MLFYLLLTVTVGKHVRTLCSQLLAEKSVSAKSFFFDFADAEENEETDSEDSEDRDFEDNDDQELAQQHLYCFSNRISTALLHTTDPFSDYHQEIGTPPPRF